MKIMEILVKDAVILNLGVRTKREVLAEMAAALAKVEPQIEADRLLEVLAGARSAPEHRDRRGRRDSPREAGGPGPAGRDLRAQREGVDFESIDGQPTHHFFLLVVPSTPAGKYLKALARISRFFRDPAFRERLTDARVPSTTSSAPSRKKTPSSERSARSAMRATARWSIAGSRCPAAGPSGVGKSECALELVRRGHRLVADDVVELELTEGRLNWARRCPPQIRHYHGDPRPRHPVRAGSLRREVRRLEMGVDLVCRLDLPGAGRRVRTRGPRAARRGPNSRGVERAERHAAQRDRPGPAWPRSWRSPREHHACARPRGGRATSTSATLRAQMGRREPAGAAHRLRERALGSGKTTAMAALEDLGFYCADNLPVQLHLVEQFLDLCAKATPPIEKIALALDAREGQFLLDLPAVRRAPGEGAEVEVSSFLEADESTLVNRYRETRRVHPLSPDGTVEEGIEAERERLLRGGGAGGPRHRHDPASTSTSCATAIVRHVSGVERAPPWSTSCPSASATASARRLELLFDVRFLPNPYFEERPARRHGLRSGRGPLRSRQRPGRGFFERLREWLGFLLPLYDDEGKAYVTIGIGCTGGRHRSVAIVEALAADLRERPRGQRPAPRRGEGNMKIGVVIVTHYRLGEEFLQALRLIVPEAPEYSAVSVEPTQSVDEMRSAIAAALKAADQGEGVLVLTDMFGGTPSNISSRSSTSTTSRS